MTKDKTKHNCSNCSAFGKHCPHKVNGDPYHYDCGMTVEDIEKENAKAKELLKQLVDIEYAINIPKEKIISLRVKAEQFIKDSEVEK